MSFSLNNVIRNFLFWSWSLKSFHNKFSNISIIFHCHGTITQAVMQFNLKLLKYPLCIRLYICFSISKFVFKWGLLSMESWSAFCLLCLWRLTALSNVSQGPSLYSFWTQIYQKNEFILSDHWVVLISHSAKNTSLAYAGIHVLNVIKWFYPFILF